MNGGKLPGSAEAEPELPAPQPAIDTSRQPEPKVTAAPEAPTPRQNTDTEAASVPGFCCRFYSRCWRSCRF